MTAMGAGPITAAMMREYEWLHCTRFELWERKALKAVDRIYSAVMREKE
jgi:hypothetical protein